MPDNLQLTVLEHGASAKTIPLTGPLELGRQRAKEPDLYTLMPASTEGIARFIIARLHEDNIARLHVILEPTANHRVRVTNESRIPLLPATGVPIPSKASVELTVPFTLIIPPRTFQIKVADGPDEFGLRSLDGDTIGPGTFKAPSQIRLPESQLPPYLLDWLQTTLGVLQSTIGSIQFLDKATEAMVNIVGLSSGRVLRFVNDEIKTLVTYPTRAASPRWQPSQHVLDCVRQQKRTFLQDADPALQPEIDTPSVRAVQTVVAAPLLHPDGRVIGALYGERHREQGKSLRPLGKLEAILVDLLATGISTGLARQEQEQLALTERVRFEQFFTPELARQLSNQPDWLEGREIEVSVLFCDIRGFSRISETVGPKLTLEWIGSVMDALSHHVLAEEGVLVDYIGDELMAMWNAPQPQPDHPERALRAALGMLATLPELNRRWEGQLGGPIDVGIGVNTGLAQVGNTGSQRKFKYGPLGNTVNLASRVQGMTKYLKCNLLATGSTRRKLGSGFIARRVCTARVVNIKEPVELYEVEKAGDPERAQFFHNTEAALAVLESREFAHAATAAGALLQYFPHDGPLRQILARAALMLANEESPFDPVWMAPGKRPD